ncbi:glycerol-3-phosphate 1-O-acyltransferase PlsY [Paludisphaera sp.]|uniref:glycerol-3-phosphate 1-O-acyltransferase PlsY n=1 Tax=Paludisphaera sp. TaxID=2017432 RepID=UPI00301BFEDF
MSWSYIAVATAAYLLGAIPFGYLIYRALTGRDVRKAGSGNIGATNVGRLLGFRFFVLVFLLDVLKGLLPTIGLPWLFARLGWDAPADLPVAAALGAILGHNFPIYLGFKGGKGVATSLGALLALQPVACGAAALAFFAVFAPSHYVSLSSMAGGLAFGATYFLRAVDPWAREHRAMSLLVVGLVVLLIVRHRKNIGRLLKGTENRIEFGRKRHESPPAAPSGMIRPGAMAGIAAIVLVAGGAGAWVARTASAPVEAVAGPWLLRETHREATGEQRAERIAFDATGDHLAVLCPRYNRVLTYRVGLDATLALTATIGVEGRPVAIAIVGGDVAVLQRPVNDAKHLGPGWLDLFTIEGGKAGTRVEAGYYPDDLAATPDGSHLMVLSSGRAEGDADKHAPELTILAARDLVTSPSPEPVGRLTFDDGDDVERLTLSHMGVRGMVALARSREALALDLADPTAPTVAGRMDLSRADSPYVSTSEDGDWMVIPAGGEAVAVAGLADGREPHAATYLVTAPAGSSDLHLLQVEPPALLGRFPILGPLNLAGAEPAALAYHEDRRLIAVATKPGTVHVVRMESRLAGEAPPPADAEGLIRPPASQ